MSEISRTVGTDGTGVTAVHSDNHKRQQKKQQRRRALINTVTDFFDNILRKPEIWVNPDLKLV